MAARYLIRSRLLLLLDRRRAGLVGVWMALQERHSETMKGLGGGWEDLPLSKLALAVAVSHEC